MRRGSPDRTHPSACFGSRHQANPSRSTAADSGSTRLVRRSRWCAGTCRWRSAPIGKSLAVSRIVGGASVPVATVQTRAGQPTSVPAGLGEGIVTVRISGVASDPLSRLQALAYRGSTWTVDDGRTTSRIPLGTASEPNVIGATGPIGYCGPLKLAPAPATITVGPAPGAPGMNEPLTLEFAVIPVAATAETDACP